MTEMHRNLKTIDTTRLPKWAQTEIAALQRKVGELERHITQLSEGPAESDTCVHSYVHPDRQLGQSAVIRFSLGEGLHNEPAIVEAHTGMGGPPGAGEPGLEIRTSGGYPHIIPVSGNAFRIRVGGY